MAAVVDPAAFQPELRARARVGTHAQTGGIDAALARCHRYRDRNLIALRLLGVGAHVDVAEVVQFGQALVQLQQRILLVGFALAVGHGLFQQGAADVRAFDLRFAEVVADAAVPGQIDAGGIPGARHFHRVALHLRVEVAARQKRALDCELAALVGGVVQQRAGVQREGGQRRAYRLVPQGFTLEVQRERIHAHRFTRFHGDGHVRRSALALDRDVGTGGIEAIGLQRRGDFIGNPAQEVGQARFFQRGAAGVVQSQERQRLAHVVQRLAFDAGHAHRPKHLRAGCDGQEEGDQQRGGCTRAHDGSCGGPGAGKHTRAQPSPAAPKYESALAMRTVVATDSTPADRVRRYSRHPTRRSPSCREASCLPCVS